MHKLRPKSSLSIILLSVAILTRGMASPPHSALGHQSVKSQDIAVFQTMLSTECQSGKLPLIVQKETVAADQLTGQLPFSSTSSKDSHGIPPSLISDLSIRNQYSQTLPQFQAKRSLLFVPHSEINKTFNSRAWIRLYKSYPHIEDWVAFSLPSYTADKSAALVYFEFWESEIGERRGVYYTGVSFGGVYYLRKEVGQWKIERRLTWWAS